MQQPNTVSIHSELKPGSKEAITAGCVCPVLDNNHGAGIKFIVKGKEEINYWINADCPLHGESQSITGAWRNG